MKISHLLLKKNTILVLVILSVLLTAAAFPDLPASLEVSAALTVNSKVLTANRAIATWPGAIPLDEKRPVLVFLPGWGGVGAVNASVSGQNMNLVNEGYVTLAIGFDSCGEWCSDIEVKAKQGLDKLCADVSIPANCSAIAFVGSSYGAAQNYWVIEYVRSNGYDGGAGSTGRALAFLSEDGGYGAPGTLDDPQTGAYTRTGLADTQAYSVAMIENLGDTTFPVDECTWGNCGARSVSMAHLTRGDQNVFSMCPPGGEHGTRGFANWNAWVVSALKVMIHETQGVDTFTGYTTPSLTITNACIDSASLTYASVASQDGWILESSETGRKGATMNTGFTTVRLGDDAARKQYRAILSFRTGELPDNAFITAVTLKVKKQAVSGGGNPLSLFQGFMVDIKKGIFGAAVLQTSDFQAAASKTYGPFSPALVSNWYNINLTSGKAYINKLSTASGLTQIRLRFKLDDNNNAIANYLSVYSGNAGAANRPQLVIEYTIE